jgi:hypothetical protein
MNAATLLAMAVSIPASALCATIIMYGIMPLLDRLFGDDS